MVSVATAFLNDVGATHEPTRGHFEAGRPMNGTIARGMAGLNPTTVNMHVYATSVGHEAASRTIGVAKVEPPPRDTTVVSDTTLTAGQPRPLQGLRERMAKVGAEAIGPITVPRPT